MFGAARQPRRLRHLGLTGAGPFTVTIAHPVAGVIISDPPGMMCGTCDDQLISCPLPDRSQPGTVCSYSFAEGTTVSLQVVAQEVYADVFCSLTPKQGTDPIPCTFVVTRDTTVTIEASEAFR